MEVHALVLRADGRRLRALPCHRGRTRREGDPGREDQVLSSRDRHRTIPSLEGNGFYKRFKVIGKELKLLYVGRVSKEKNLPRLVEVFKKLAALRTGIRLVVVGEGPYLEEMKQALEGFAATFTGFLDGDDLPQAYASSDIFLFPSTTDTFGNVVLEAEASGIPVVVTDEGPPTGRMACTRPSASTTDLSWTWALRW